MTVKTSNSLKKTMHAQACTNVVADDVRDAVEEDDMDKVEDVVGGGEDATTRKTTGGDATTQ
jgi:hypothetical protein